MRPLSRLLAALATALILTLASGARAVTVDVELQLLVDVSMSVDASEFALQRDGYANAFRSQQVIDAILAGPLGRVAVQFAYWAGASQQQVLFDSSPGGFVKAWTLIQSAQDANAFADFIGSQPNTLGGVNTAPGSAIFNLLGGFGGNGFEGTRLVIDVSGDGVENEGVNTAAARNAALSAGIDQINGLVILGQEPGTLGFYQGNVAGGTGAFVVTANSFADFEATVRAKLVREIVPEPGAALLLALGLAGLAALRRTER